MTYEQLDQFINAYFHQDWSDDHDDEASVLADFMRTNWKDDVQVTIAQLDRYLAEHPDGLLASFVSDFNPTIIIGANDVEARTWLESVRDYMVQHLSDSPIRRDGRVS